MKKLLMLALLLGLASAARAQSQVYTALSSATWCSITVSTSAPTRVDNFNGSCEGIMTSRSVVRVINSTGTLHAGFDATLSTQPSSSKYGEVVSASSKMEYELSSKASLYLMSESAPSAQNVIIQQGSFVSVPLRQ